MKEPKILLFWSAVTQGASYYLVSTYGQRGARWAIAANSLTWMGSIVAISMTESWTKFRSKILERQVGLDVGRLVFDALNTLEMAFCSTILTLLFKHESMKEEMWAQPVVLGIILLLQVSYLTPQLEMRAFHIACDALANKKHATRAEEAAYKEYKAMITLRKMPPMWLHHLYVFLEIAKIGILFKTAETMLRESVNV